MSSSPPRNNNTNQNQEDIPPSSSSSAPAAAAVPAPTTRSAAAAAATTTNTRNSTTTTTTNRRTLGQSSSTQNLAAGSGTMMMLPHNASNRSLTEMSARSMDSPRSASNAAHEVIEFLRSQSVAQEDLDNYRKVFDDQLLRNFSDIKEFGEDRLGTNGVKRGHARRIFGEIERRDREQQQQRSRMLARRGGAGGGMPQSISTANLYGALYDMTPVATPVAGESHGMFPNISNSNLDNMMANNNNTNKGFSDPNDNSNQDDMNSVVAVNNSSRAKNDPFRTSAVVVPGDFVCGMCCELLFSARTVACGHTFCALCLERWASSQQGAPTCPLCRASLIPNGAPPTQQFELPPVNSLIEGLCQRCFPGRYQRSARSAEEQRRADEEIRLAYALVRHPADGLLVKILLNSINVSRPLELLFLRLPRREFLPPSFLPSANRIETGSISPTPVEGYGFNMTSASLHATIMTALQLEPGHWFLDAGAGTGIVAAWAATLVGPTGTSLALDHDTKAAQLMRRNRIIHDQLLFHPTMPLSGANFSGEVTTLSNKYCLFPNLASAPIAGRRTQFQNLLLNPTVYEANETNRNGSGNNNNDDDGDPRNSSNSRNKNLPIAVQILGIERSSAFLDRFAGVAGKKNHHQSASSDAANNNNNNKKNLGLPGVSPLSPQSQQQLPFGGGGCVVHATVTVGNSATSSRRQCRMVGTVRLVAKTDQFQVLSSAQHQQARQAAKTRITPTTHPRSFSPNENNTETQNNNNFTSADEIPPVLPNRSQQSGGIRLDFNNFSSNNNNNSNNNNSAVASSPESMTQQQRSLSSSLSDESVLCDITDANDILRRNQQEQEDISPTTTGAAATALHSDDDNVNNSSASTTSATSPRYQSKFSSNDHHVLFSLREVSVFGSDDTHSIYNFGDQQDVDHERLMRFTFCLTKPIGELLEMTKKREAEEEEQKRQRQSNPQGFVPHHHHTQHVPLEAFGIFVASYPRRSDVVATTKLHLLDGSNVLRQLKRWIDGTWVPSESKPHKYHCLQTNVYDFAQVLFGKDNHQHHHHGNNPNIQRDKAILNETRDQILDLIKPKVAQTGHQNNNNNAQDVPLQQESSSSTMMMMERTNTMGPSSSSSNIINNNNNDDDSNNNNKSYDGFFDRIFLACEPQSEADLKRFQKLLKPGGRMVVPFDSELLLITRPSLSSNSTPVPGIGITGVSGTNSSSQTSGSNNNAASAASPSSMSASPQQQNQQQPEFTRESLYQVGFGTFVVPDHRRRGGNNEESSSSSSSSSLSEDDNNNNGNDNENDSPPGSPKAGPCDQVSKRILEAIEDEKSHMTYLQESYRLYSLSAMRNRTLKNSPLLLAGSSNTAAGASFSTANNNNNNGTTASPSALPKMTLPPSHNNNNTDDNLVPSAAPSPMKSSSSHNNNSPNSITAKNILNSPFHNNEPANEPIFLRCCGSKLSSSQWNETIDVEKVWGTAPFSDGRAICIPRPASASEYHQLFNKNSNNSNGGGAASSASSHPTTFLKRAKGTSYLAYNIDLSARMSYVSCSHCDTIVGAEFCDEPLLTQPFGPWTGRVLMCRSMLCKRVDLVPDDADISASAITCTQCDNPLALASWKLRSEIEMRLRSGSRHRSFLANADYSGVLFTNVRKGSVRFQGQVVPKNGSNNNNRTGNGNSGNDSNNNNNNNQQNERPSTLKMFTDSNLYIGDVHCSKCNEVIGFRVLGCKNPFAKNRYAFALGRIVLIPQRVKGMPGSAHGGGGGAGPGSLRQPHNLMERIYRAIAQSFGINPTEGTRFILRDGSGNATIFDGTGGSAGGNLITWRGDAGDDGDEGEGDGEDAAEHHHHHEGETDEDDADDAGLPPRPSVHLDDEEYEEDDEDLAAARHRIRNMVRDHAQATGATITTRNNNRNNREQDQRRRAASTSSQRNDDDDDDDENERELPLLNDSTRNNPNYNATTTNSSSNNPTVTMIRRSQQQNHPSSSATNTNNNNQDAAPQQQQRRQNTATAANNNNNTNDQNVFVSRQAVRDINAALAEQLVADFDFEDTVEPDDDEEFTTNISSDDDDDVPPVIQDTDSDDSSSDQ